MELDERHGIGVRVRGPHDEGQKRMAGKHADHRARKARDRTVERELLDDIAVVVAERLERAGIDALFVDHARHGGEGHERGHEVEEVREDASDGIDDLGYGRVDGIAL